jgi:hypothetical protein
MVVTPCLNCVRLEREVAELRAQVERLTRLLEAQRRSGKRQAAPFAKGPPKPEPKKPGRKPGKDYGTKAHRQPPEHIDEVHEAPLPEQCPNCGGDVEETHVDQQYQVEIPRRPIQRQFNIHIGCCQQCQRRVQGRHPLQTSDAQCLGHLLRRCHDLLETATRGAVCFPRRISELLQHGRDLRDRHAAGQLSDHGLAVCRGRLHNDLLDLLTFLKHPGVDATNWRGELAMRFGVILRKVWGGKRTWIGAHAQAVLMSVWRTCWQRSQNAVNFLSHLLRRCRPALVGVPP